MSRTANAPPRTHREQLAARCATIRQTDERNHRTTQHDASRFMSRFFSSIVEEHSVVVRVVTRGKAVHARRSWYSGRRT